MPPRLVVFDMAGTTVADEGVVNRCFRAACSEAGLELEPEVVDSVMGLPKPEAVVLLVGRSPLAEKLAGQVDAIHARFVEIMIDHYRTDPAVRAIDGVGPMLDRLKKAGVLIAMDTGFSRPIADVILDRLGWKTGGPVDATITSDEVERGRPAPDMTLALMSRLGVTDPKTVAKVGDAPADLGEGTSAGCGWVVGVTWGSHRRDQLAAHPHTHLVDTMDELSALLLPGD
ncbi:MAG: HAD hydrolase-like protein [Isosphaeraceae bacterium]